MASDQSFFDYTLGGNAFVNATASAGPIQAPPPLPEPQVQPEDMVFGCYQCRALRPRPASYKYGLPPGRVRKNQWGGLDPLPPSEFGRCYACSGFLQEITCPCGEPLHQAERFCRFCGNDMKPFHMCWGTWWEPPTEEELAQRGNLEEEGSVFRGVRES